MGTQISGKQIKDGSITADDLLGITTDNLVEGGTNLYFTNARADSRVTIVTAEANDSIVPAADGTYSLPTSITIVKGIITAIS